MQSEWVIRSKWKRNIEIMIDEDNQLVCLVIQKRFDKRQSERKERKNKKTDIKIHTKKARERTNEMSELIS